MSTARDLLIHVGHAARALAVVDAVAMLTVVTDPATVRAAAALDGHTTHSAEADCGTIGRRIITTYRWQVGSGARAVYVVLQGDEPVVAPAPALLPDTCSECKGPLDEEAGYSPGSVTCRQCLDREEAAEALERKKCHGNVRAEERAIDAGIRGGA